MRKLPFLLVLLLHTIFTPKANIMITLAVKTKNKNAAIVSKASKKPKINILGRTASIVLKILTIIKKVPLCLFSLTHNKINPTVDIIMAMQKKTKFVNISNKRISLYNLPLSAKNEAVMLTMLAIVK